MDTIIKRQVHVRALGKKNSFRDRNEALPDKNGNVHEFNSNRVSRIWARIDKTNKNVRAFKPGAEEHYYMPDLIGKVKDDKDYYKTVEEFWKSVLITFPENLGLMLDVSFDIREGEETSLMIDGKMTKVLISKESFLKYTKDRPDLEYLFGHPVNLKHYWQWRFCLNTAQVANSKEIADTKYSKNIHFYLETRQEQKQKLANTNKVKQIAVSLMLKFMQNDTVVEGVLRSFEKGANHEGIKYHEIFSVNDMSPEEKVACYMDIADKLPAQFTEIVEDKDLFHKTLAKRALNQNIIHNESGTTIYQFGEDVIANSFSILIRELKTNKSLYDRIFARLDNISPLKPIEDFEKVVKSKAVETEPEVEVERVKSASKSSGKVSAKSKKK